MNMTFDYSVNLSTFDHHGRRMSAAETKQGNAQPTMLLFQDKKLISINNKNKLKD